MPIIALTNNFHNTTANVRVCWHKGTAVLTRRQTARIRHALCPIHGCTCGETILNTRGPQRIQYSGWGAGSVAYLQIYEAGFDKMDCAVIEYVS